MKVLLAGKEFEFDKRKIDILAMAEIENDIKAAGEQENIVFDLQKLKELVITQKRLLIAVIGADAAESFYLEHGYNVASIETVNAFCADLFQKLKAS